MNPEARTKMIARLRALLVKTTANGCTEGEMLLALEKAAQLRAEYAISDSFPLLDAIGFLPEIIRADDHRPVREQIASRYAHGGGYSPFGEGKWKLDPTTHVLTYPGDESFAPLASAQIGEETIYVYASAIVAIVQPDGSFAVTRMD